MALLSEDKRYIPTQYVEYRKGYTEPSHSNPVDISGNTPWHFWLQNYWNTLSLETDKHGAPVDQRWLIPNRYGVTPLHMRMAAGVPFFNPEKGGPDWSTPLWRYRLPNGMSAAELYACYALMEPPGDWYFWLCEEFKELPGYLLASGQFPKQLCLQEELYRIEIPPAVKKYLGIDEVNVIFDSLWYKSVYDPVTGADRSSMAMAFRPPAIRTPLIPVLRLGFRLGKLKMPSRDDIHEILGRKDQYYLMGAEGMNLVEALFYIGKIEGLESFLVEKRNTDVQLDASMVMPSLYERLKRHGENRLDRGYEVMAPYPPLSSYLIAGVMGTFPHSPHIPRNESECLEYIKTEAKKRFSKDLEIEQIPLLNNDAPLAIKKKQMEFDELCSILLNRG